MGTLNAFGLFSLEDNSIKAYINDITKAITKAAPRQLDLSVRTLEAEDYEMNSHYCGIYERPKRPN